MIAAVSPSSEQIRYYALSALNGFDDLDVIDAISNAKSELCALVSYLDALAPTDDAVPIFGLRVIDGGARLERLGGNAQIDNPSDLKVVRG